jgi:chromosome condensin MukBEF MukE localization factor
MSDKKYFTINDFEDGQALYLKSRGKIIVEDNQFGRSRGFINDILGYHTYDSVSFIPELMENHGFFLNEEDYKEWKTLWYEKNICKCCLQEKSITSDVDTGKLVYLIRGQKN